MALRQLVAVTAVLLAAAHTAAAQTPPAGCTLQLGSQALAFTKCLPIAGVGDNFVLYWNLTGPSSAVWGMSTTSTGGYVAFAFPEQAGDMVPADAFSLQECSSCPNGAQLRQFYLGGTSSGDIEPSSNIPLSGVNATATTGGGLAAVFEGPLPTGANASALPLIFAAGAVYSNGYIRQHEEYGSGILNTNTGSLADAESENDGISALVAAHLWLLVIGWGVLIPCGVAIARVCKGWDPLWFHLHRAAQCLGLLLGLVGLALGFVIAGGWNGLFPVHRNLGMAATILGLVQIPALRWRPKLTSPYRRMWNQGHWWIGRAAVLVAVANIYYGFINVLDVSPGAWAAYTAVFGVIVGAAILKEGYDYVRVAPPTIKADGHNIVDGGATWTANTAAEHEFDASTAEPNSHAKEVSLAQLSQ